LRVSRQSTAKPVLRLIWILFVSPVSIYLMAKPLRMKYVWGVGNALKVSTRNRMRLILCIWPGSCTTRSVLHVRTERARRRAVRPDRCAATVSATRLGVICLVPRRIGARSPAAHPLDDARRSATARNSSLREPGRQPDADARGVLNHALADLDQALADGRELCLAASTSSVELPGRPVREREAPCRARRQAG
jgi:hypothetical protein